MTEKVSSTCFQIARVNSPNKIYQTGILSIEFKREPIADCPLSKKKDKEKAYTSQRICLIHFASYSAARKTLETLKDEKRFIVSSHFSPLNL